jgi:hypothetical protein
MLNPQWRQPRNSPHRQVLNHLRKQKNKQNQSDVSRLDFA